MKEFLTKFDVYLMSRERLADLSRKAYVTDVGIFLDFLTEARISMDKIKIGSVSAFHKYMFNKGYLPRTRARKINSVKRFYLYLHREQGFPNWTSYFTTPPFTKPLPNILTKKEVVELLRATYKSYDPNKKRNQLIIFLLYGCGLRASELVSIRVGDINLADSMLRVFGKGSRERLLPIPSLCMEVLQPYLQKIDTDENALLFGTLYANKIRPMTRQNIYAIIQEIWKRTGLKKKIYPHLIRHSFASHMMNNGANIREIQTLLGHERLSSTQVYTHLTLEKIRKSYDSLHIRA